MDITIKQAKELRKKLLEQSPELLELWKQILNPKKDNEENEK